MKKKSVYLRSFVILFIFYFSSRAQVTINSNALAKPGQKIYTATAYTTIPTGIVAGNPGTNQFWNFSSLLPEYNDSLIFLDADSTAYNSFFPAANLASGIPTYFDYYLNDASGFYSLGQAGDAYATGGQCPTIYSPDYKLMLWPATYGQHFIDTMDAVLPPCSTSSTTNDSQAFHAQYIYEVSADAWGTMQLPNATFNCVRFKRTTTYIDTVWSHYNGNPWNIAIIASGAYEQYEWWTNDTTAGYRIAYMVMDTVNNVSTYVSWLEVGGTTTSVNPDLLSSSVKIYPNPAKNSVTVSSSFTGNKTINIKDLTGRIIIETTTELNAKKIDISSLLPGIYFVEIFTDGKFAERKVLQLVVE